MNSLCCCCSKTHYQRQYQDQGKLVQQYHTSTRKLKNSEYRQSVVRMQKSDYKQLKKKYKGDKKFTDGQFPPGARSLGKIPNIPEDCEWKRISEIISSPKLFVDGVQPSDVVHGSLDDCYFLSAVASLAQDEKRIKRIFGDQEYNPNGLYKVALRVDGKVQQIIIDDYVPVNRAGKPLFCQPNSDQIWVVLLQKAWAKANGSYGNISSGTPTDVFKAVSYAPAELKPIKFSHQSRNKIWQDIIFNTKRGNPVCASTIRDKSSGIEATGLQPGHGYTLVNNQLFQMNAAELQDQDGDTFKVLKLRNPWGISEWQGVGSENDQNFWSNISNSQQKQLFLRGLRKQKDGIFTMRFQDFCDYFNEINMCYLLEYPKYQVEKLNCNKKNGTIYDFTVTQAGDYLLQLHQSNQNRNQPQSYKNICRSTLLLAKGQNYQFIDGSLKYQEQDNILKTRLDPGKYYLYAKIDPVNKIPDELSVSCYSEYFVDIQPTKKSKHSNFFNKVFLSYARQNITKTYNNDKMWISWKLFFERGGYAYIAFGVKQDSDKKFIIKFDQKDFEDLGYTLKKPHKKKGKQQMVIKPGEEEAIVARVKNGPIQTMKFPPHFDIEMDKA